MFPHVNIFSKALSFPGPHLCCPIGASPVSTTLLSLSVPHVPFLVQRFSGDVRHNVLYVADGGGAIHRFTLAVHGGHQQWVVSLLGELKPALYSQRTQERVRNKAEEAEEAEGISRVSYM